MKLKKNFFNEDPSIVAKNLLGKTLVRVMDGKELRAKIVETEAYYDKNDPASRARQNGDLKDTMEMDAGTILVYGVHNSWLINFVTGKKGDAAAVLLRALEPENFDVTTKGPGLLTKALNIKKEFHKLNILNSELIWVEDSKKNKFEIVESFRIGVHEDLPEKLRFYIKDCSWISKK